MSEKRAKTLTVWAFSHQQPVPQFLGACGAKWLRIAKGGPIVRPPIRRSPEMQRQTPAAPAAAALADSLGRIGATAATSGPPAQVALYGLARAAARMIR